MRGKRKFKFSHRSDDGRTYYWISVEPIGPNESRHEQVWCGVEYFWHHHEWKKQAA